MPSLNLYLARGNMTAPEIDQVLAHVRAQMHLDSETEHEVLEEIRSHLEEAVAVARAQGLDEQAALAEAAARFGGGDIVPIGQPAICQVADPAGQ